MILSEEWFMFIPTLFAYSVLFHLLIGFCKTVRKCPSVFNLKSIYKVIKNVWQMFSASCKKLNCDCT